MNQANTNPVTLKELLSQFAHTALPVERIHDSFGISHGECLYGLQSLFSLNNHLEAQSKHGEPPLKQTVELEYPRDWLVEGLGHGDGNKGGRSPLDPVPMFKTPTLQAQHNLPDTASSS